VVQFPNIGTWQPGGLWIYIYLVPLGGVRLSPLGTSATVCLLYQPRMIDDDDYGAVGGMKIGRRNRSTRRKPDPVSLCPPQIPHNLTWDRTRSAAVGSQRLTAWAMTRPFSGNILWHQFKCLFWFGAVIFSLSLWSWRQSVLIHCYFTEHHLTIFLHSSCRW
jgi:hypothetical protein